MTHSTLPTTIHASIDPAAIGRVNAFFDATAEQTIAELYQNARRSGATRIVVTAGRDGRIEVLDNGSGIADPAAVLPLGRSDWQDCTRSRDTAASSRATPPERRPGASGSSPVTSPANGPPRLKRCRPQTRRPARRSA